MFPTANSKLAKLFSEDVSIVFGNSGQVQVPHIPHHPPLSLSRTHTHAHSSSLLLLPFYVLPSVSSDEQKSPGAFHWPRSTLRGELIGQLGPSRLLETGHWPRKGSSGMSLVRLSGNLAKLQVFSLEESLVRKKIC